MNIDNQKCFIQINRNYLEALGFRALVLGQDKGRRIVSMLKLVDAHATALSTKYLNNLITDKKSSIAYEIYEAINNNNFLNTVDHKTQSDLLSPDTADEKRIATEAIDRTDSISSFRVAEIAKPLDKSVYQNSAEQVDDALFDWVLVRFFDKLQGAIIKTTTVFDELMAHTDIDKVPLSYLIPPYQALYFQFNDSIEFRSTELNIEGYLTGAYLFSRKIDNQLHLEIHLIRMNSNNEQVHFARDVKQIDISETGGVLSGVDKLASFKTDDNELEATLNQVYETVFKTILYMGLKDARIREVHDRTSYEKKLHSVKAKKAKKLANKVNFSYNYILVGSENDEVLSTKNIIADNGRVMPVHWRRGHLRKQNYGQNNSLSHIVWIQPVLINQKLATDPASIQPKEYHLGKRV